MKIVKIIVRVLVVGGVVGATGYLTQKTITYVRRIDVYSVTITGNITDQARENIAQYVQTSWPASTHSFSQLCAAAQEQFACIKDLDIALLPGKKAHVEISVREPLYIVNNDQVVTHDGVLLAKSIYEPQAIENLYQISISGIQSLLGAQERGALSLSCKQSLAQVTPDFLDRYFFAWQNDNAAWLYPREYHQDSINKNGLGGDKNGDQNGEKNLAINRAQNNTQLAILFHPLSIPATKILEYCDELKQDLGFQKNSKSQQVNKWVADVRFKDQIIVSANTETAAHTVRHNLLMSTVDVIEKKTG